MKKILITGASRGLGLKLSIELAKRGDEIYMGVRDIKSTQLKIQSYLNQYSNMKLVELDVTNDSHITNLVNFLMNNNIIIDVLVNNAGINYDTWHSGYNANIQNIKETFETNFYGPLKMIQAIYPILKKSSSPRIVNVSSEAGSLAQMAGGTPGYSTSKAALNALTRIFSSEFSKDNILVNSVCPGWCATDMGGMGGRDPIYGVKSILWAIDLRNNGQSGEFFSDGKKVPW